MALDKKDLDNIRVVAKDIVDFAIDQSEQSMEKRMEKMLDQKLDQKLAEQENRIVEKINREISSIAEMNRAFLAKMDNHEGRIEKLEAKTASF